MFNPLDEAWEQTDGKNNETDSYTRNDGKDVGLGWGGNGHGDGSGGLTTCEALSESG